ncbi:MAG: galactokinase family protein [Acutalibacteraceae bacterium]|nr:galactokinase family protein [Acutalibacteraceae bacterium]
MNILQIKEAINEGKLDNTFKKLYPYDVLVARKRYTDALCSFEECFGDRENIRIFSAPGRTEVGGNHTDHQHGRVLAGSVNLDVIGIVAANENNTVCIESCGYKVDPVDLSNLDIEKTEYGKTSALIRGCCAFFKKAGYNIGGFDAYTTSDVLGGSGLSSSAAYEVLICNILSGLFNNNSVDRVEIAKISQKAEREYFGKPCGLLDQMASSQGGFTAIDFNNPDAPVVEQISFDLASHGYTLCVVDTHGDHADLTQDYADITIECKEISNYFGKEFLRDVEKSEFFSSLADLREKFGDRAVLRAIHFFGDDERAEEQKIALKQDNFDHFLDLVNESGDSSYKYLQNVYSISNVKEQGLCLALSLTEMFLKGEGACRVHGGGFAGTIQCYIPTDRIIKYSQMIDSVFGKGSCCILSIRPIGGCEIMPC